jgi:2-phospho-L-lactate guanylyltransferase (CobY/MobA/RfbA family)
MQSLSDDERKQVLGEVLMDELKAIHELVSDIPVIKKDVAQLKDDVSELKDDVKAIKAVVTNHSRELKDHEGRISALQAA